MQQLILIFNVSVLVKEDRIQESNEKQYGMQDFCDKGVGMQDLDPSPLPDPDNPQVKVVQSWVKITQDYFEIWTQIWELKKQIQFNSLCF